MDVGYLICGRFWAGAMNYLYTGDNLDVLRERVDTESVDLVYLDPPFKSDQNYNILFQEQDGSRSAAQIQAFEDTWQWDQRSAAAYQEVVESGGRVSQAMQAFRPFIGDSDMLAYLSMMAPRLVELHRVLKKTGSLYLHCDPTASHYLKILLDAIFRPENFRNEVVWKRTHSHGSSKRYGPVHDIIFFYTKSDRFKWTNPRVPHDAEYIEKHFTQLDEDGRAYQPISLTGAGVRHGESGKPWKGIDPTAVGRHWAVPASALHGLGVETETVQDKLDALDNAGLIYWPKKHGGTPRLKWYADQLEGVAIPDLWTDINPVPAQASERIGYPTQKPEALLERIIQASTQDGDTVLDPFCGCGTATAAAERLNREWIAIDITHLATSLIKHRLRDSFGPNVEYQTWGDPTDLQSARALALESRFQFQCWAVGKFDAQPLDSKRGADRGIDGRLYFHDEPEGGKTKQIIFQVKSGKPKVTELRDLRGVVERERAAIGVYITLENPTKAMVKEAASAGYYHSTWNLGDSEMQFPRIQIITIEELLEGKRPAFPPSKDLRTFKKPRFRRPKGKEKQQDLF